MPEILRTYDSVGGFSVDRTTLINEKKDVTNVNSFEVKNSFYSDSSTNHYILRGINTSVLSTDDVNSTIPIPAANPLPVSDLANPLNTSKPNPFPPINGVTICIAKAIITVWLNPITKLGIANGNLILFRVCNKVPPNERETSE